MCLVDKMADFTSLLFESINLIPHPLGHALTFKTRFWLATRGSDPDVLQPWHKCGPSRQLGTFRHDDDLQISQPGLTSKMKIRFHRFPLLSGELDTSSKTSFSVEILDFQLV